jgi:ferredoxin-NADP reductase
MREITVKGRLRDTIAFIRHLRARERIFAAANTDRAPSFPAPMNRLSAQLHPRGLLLTVLEARRENAGTVTYRLGSAESLPLFRAGQYISVQADIRGSVCSRPYSLSSLPIEAIEGPFYEITVKRTDPGYVSPYIIDTWKTGRGEIPPGLMTLNTNTSGQAAHSLLASGPNTPFRSLIPATLKRYPVFRALS